jgi:hypothetical protein
MLIGSASRRPNLKVIRRIKTALRRVLDLSEADMITVTQLACLEEDCAPLETVIGLLRSGSAQLQHKIHKETDSLDAGDLLQVCESWGFSVQLSAIESALKEI